jgi:hypothetical protein
MREVAGSSPGLDLIKIQVLQGLIVTSVKGGKKKLPKISKIIETYSYDHSLESS